MFKDCWSRLKSRGFSQPDNIPKHVESNQFFLNKLNSEWWRVVVKNFSLFIFWNKMQYQIIKMIIIKKGNKKDSFYFFKVWNSQVTKWSYGTELCKTMSQLKLLTQRFNFYFSSFELLTRTWKVKISLRITSTKIKLLFFYFRVTDSKLKNKISNFELLTQSQKIKKNLLRVTNLIVKHFLFHFRVIKPKLKNKNFTSCY